MIETTQNCASGRSSTPWSEQFLIRLKAFLSHLMTLAFSGMLLVLIYWGWSVRGEHLFTAEEGWGYALGIIGGSMMLLLLIYPLRKRLRSMSRWGSVRMWFRIHMFCGVVGPTIILFHSSFSLGSLNSSVALISMLLVAGSGLIGRYMYARIHHGLYGAHREMQEFQLATDEAELRLESEIAFDENDTQRIHAYGQQFLSDSKSVLLSTHELVLTSIRTRLAMIRETALLNGQGRKKKEIRKARKLLHGYFSAIRRTARFRFYRNMFGLWHILHLPLFVMMLVTGITHVFAVHIY